MLSFHRSAHDDCRRVIVAGLHVRSFFDQHLRELLVAALACDQQRGLAPLVHRLDRRTSC